MFDFRIENDNKSIGYGYSLRKYYMETSIK